MAEIATTIRKAIDTDSARILDWLKAEDDQGVAGCFWCNRAVLQAGHSDGRVTALIDIATDEPIGFCLRDDPISSLEVRHDHRRRGLGCLFAGEVIAHVP